MRLLLALVFQFYMVKSLTFETPQNDEVSEKENVLNVPRMEKSLVGTIVDHSRPGGHLGHHGHHGIQQRTPTSSSLPHSFPFLQQTLHSPPRTHLDNHKGHVHHGHQLNDQPSFNVKGSEEIQPNYGVNVNFIDKLANLKENADGRRCVDKVMLVEETEYDEVLTCDHSYDERCHTSYVTKYEPHQEEECEEKFRKECLIDYEKKSLEEVVQYCITPMVKNCDIEGEEVCQTVYQSECYTKQIVHQVEDDVPQCETINEERCEEVTVGYRTEQKCDTWPREVCKLTKQDVKKYTPETVCEKVPREMCAPKDCGFKEGPVECRDKVKTVIVDNPVEECDMEPIRTCKHVTKLVPRLVATQECVDVPKEVCARSRINPRKVQKPAIQKWCFKPNDSDKEAEEPVAVSVHEVKFG